MPRNHPAPRCALLSAFEARRWSGVELYRRADEDAGEGVVMPAFDDGEGTYLDAVQFLGGFGAGDGAGLAARLTVAWLALGGDGDGFTAASINGADRVTLTFDGGGEKAELLSTGPAAALLGWPSGTGEIDDGTIAAPSDWRRGPVRLAAGLGPAYLRLRRVGAGSTVVPLPMVQDVRTLIRGTVADDLDTPAASCLAALDRTRYELDLTWHLDDDGHSVWSGIGTLGPITWQSITFRDRLGYTGLEAPVTENLGSGILTRCRADRPMPGVVVPSRPPQRIVEWGRGFGDALRLVDGRAGSVLHAAAAGLTLDLLIDGYHDSAFAGLDLHRHLRRMLAGDHDADELALAAPGDPLTLYQDFGDSRRALAAEVATVERELYGLLYTAESNGWRGRRLCRVDPESERDIEADARGPFRRRYPVTLNLSHRERGV